MTLADVAISDQSLVNQNLLNRLKRELREYYRKPRASLLELVRRDMELALYKLRAMELEGS